ncbi:MAG: hypothetical protein WBW74_15265 [Xanthobacteraceae bacterium]
MAKGFQGRIFSLARILRPISDVFSKQVVVAGDGRRDPAQQPAVVA